MKILIYGSTYFTEVIVNKIKDKFDLIGYIPSKNPIFPGNIDLKIVNEEVEYDIGLCLQYDGKIKDNEKCFNLHTGLLPDYGGCDIFLHTLINKELYQGLTFHKITDKFDYGPIVSKITYPVFKNDTALTLYKRLCLLAPEFAENSIYLLKNIGLKNVNKCKSFKPKIYKRGKFNSKYRKLYIESYNEIQQWIKEKHL
jgi:hypothetical protein